MFVSLQVVVFIAKVISSGLTGWVLWRLLGFLVAVMHDTHILLQFHESQYLYVV